MFFFVVVVVVLGWFDLLLFFFLLVPRLSFVFFLGRIFLFLVHSSSIGKVLLGVALGSPPESVGIDFVVWFCLFVCFCFFNKKEMEPDRKSTKPIPPPLAHQPKKNNEINKTDVGFSDRIGHASIESYSIGSILIVFFFLSFWLMELFSSKVFSRFYRVLLLFVCFLAHSTVCGFLSVLNQFYWVSMGFTGFFFVSLDFTGF